MDSFPSNSLLLRPSPPTPSTHSMLLFPRKPRASRADVDPLMSMPKGISRTAALRLEKDIHELRRCKLPPKTTVDLSFPAGIESNVIHLLLSPREGLYHGAQFQLQFIVPAEYPFRPPVVHCLNRVAHPNVELPSGRIALPILGPAWKPVLCLREVVIILQDAFVDPDMSAPAPASFVGRMGPQPLMIVRSKVRATLVGGLVDGVIWRRNLHHVSPPPMVTGKKRQRQQDEERDLDEEMKDVCESLQRSSFGERHAKRPRSIPQQSFPMQLSESPPSAGYDRSSIHLSSDSENALSFPVSAPTFGP